MSNPPNIAVGCDVRHLGGCVLAVMVSLCLLPATAAGEREETVSFVNDILPVFTKAGCNAGVCHAMPRPAVVKMDFSFPSGL